jgi:hypothetical protein
MPRQKRVQPRNVKRKTATQKRNSKAKVKTPVVVSEATKNLCRNWLKSTVGQAERPEIESGDESDRDNDYVNEEVEQVRLHVFKLNQINLRYLLPGFPAHLGQSPEKAAHQFLPLRMRMGWLQI